jgi:predicted SprT family Zn-dependent metalloprotease
MKLYGTKHIETSMRKQKEPITPAQYKSFQVAYDFFNLHLFGGLLPHVLVTLQRHSKSYGYFLPDRFSGRTEKTTVHELAMNPDGFSGRTDEEVLSTLAHEMVHVWQQTFGEAPRSGYHDREWAAKMKTVGLYPSHDGTPGGKETGQHMTHYIIPDGVFAKTYANLKATGLQLEWESEKEEKQKRAAKATSKTKYTCPECGQNAWAKPEASLVCGECSDTDSLVGMEPQI